MTCKTKVQDFAVAGGKPVFDTVKPTSNLVKPNKETFLNYLFQSKSRETEKLSSLLEDRLANFHQVKHCIVLNSGFWALAVLVKILSKNSNPEVIIPSLTYRRLGDVVAWCDKTPVFCDVDKSTLALSRETVEGNVNSQTSLIIGVHPVGNHVDIDGLEAISQRQKIPLIFDSVESVAEEHNGKVLGASGDAEIYSLGASKLINGFEGGYITTNDCDLAKRLRSYQSDAGERTSLTLKLPDVHIAAALSGLDDLAAQQKRNNQRYETYERELCHITSLKLKRQDPKTKPSHKNIIVELKPDWPFSLTETLNVLNAENILARAYSPPITEQAPSYKFKAADLPVTKWAMERFISMPCGHLVDAHDIEIICATLSSMINFSSGLKDALK